MFKLKYITMGQEILFILYMLAGMLLCYGVLYTTIYFIWNDHETPIYVGPGLLLLGIIIWGFCFYNADTRRRNRYKKHGECFPGVIVGADRQSIPRGKDEYFLIIEFEENGEKKIKYTQGYSGNPIDYLQSCKCNIYKWRGRYIEADLQVKQSRKQVIELRIPIGIYKDFDRKRKYYV